MATSLEFTVGDSERHQVVYTWDQFTGRLRITVDGREVVSTIRMFSVRTSADYELTVAFRPQTITAYVHGRGVARTEGTMRRGRTIGIGVLIGVLFVGGLALQLITQAR